ncbi:hypothetical protein [Salinisphaera aquimarina]|uniref:Uncharacterized protein n=1 Tax=Salinisphaera aquimarina TaxID=2094031 RepID=A0ABV7EKS0_9GAMM
MADQARVRADTNKPFSVTDKASARHANAALRSMLHLPHINRTDFPISGLKPTKRPDVVACPHLPAGRAMSDSLDEMFAQGTRLSGISPAL